MHDHKVIDPIPEPEGAYPLSSPKPEHAQLRQCCVWARVFLKEAGRELTGQTNDHYRAANQLMVLLAEFTVGK